MATRLFSLNNIIKYNLEFLHRTCTFFVIFRPFQKNCKYFLNLYKSSLVALFCQIEACNNTTQSFLSRRVQHQIGVAVVLNSERVQHQLDVAVVLVWRDCITKLELQLFWIQRECNINLMLRLFYFEESATPNWSCSCFDFRESATSTWGCGCFILKRVQHQIGVAVVLNSERVQHQLDVAVVLLRRERNPKLELQLFASRESATSTWCCASLHLQYATLDWSWGLRVDIF